MLSNDNKSVKWCNDFNIFSIHNNFLDLTLNLFSSRECFCCTKAYVTSIGYCKCDCLEFALSIFTISYKLLHFLYSVNTNFINILVKRFQLKWNQIRYCYKIRLCWLSLWIFFDYTCRCAISSNLLAAKTRFTFNPLHSRSDSPYLCYISTSTIDESAMLVCKLVP